MLLVERRVEVDEAGFELCRRKGVSKEVEMKGKGRVRTTRRSWSTNLVPMMLRSLAIPPCRQGVEM